MGRGAVTASGAGRTILDISSIARWRGPAVGILRVEQALARYALAQRPDVVLSFYDKENGCFRAINPLWAAHLVSWQGAVGRRRGKLLSLLPSPYSVIGALERLRLACRGDATTRGIEHVQRLVLLLRRRRRRGVVPYRLAVKEPLVLGPRDIILSVGSDWTHKDAARIAALKKQVGFGYVVMSHDIIPLLFPQYFLPDDVAAFRRYWTTMFSTADEVLINSRCVASDVADYCARNSIALSPCRIAQLGYDPVPALAKASLPKGLEAGRFALFVSTIEPRKGHGMLIRVWEKLLAANVPQRERFKLVLVGRRGWQVDAILDRINDSATFGGTLMHLVGVSDDDLAALYRATAFCVYPSHYEGFGLPAIEAFSHGKAVIASTGGALPETVDGFSVCLDLADEKAWFETLRTWIEDPSARERYEAKIRADFKWPDWDHAAAQIFSAVAAVSVARDRAAKSG